MNFIVSCFLWQILEDIQFGKGMKNATFLGKFKASLHKLNLVAINRSPILGNIPIVLQLIHVSSLSNLPENVFIKTLGSL